MNGGRNYNGPKVRLASLSKIWLYAGKSEHPPLLVLSNWNSNNVRGADNPQERPDRFRTEGGGEVDQAFVRHARKRGKARGESVITGDNHLLPFHGCPSRDQNRIDSESSETVRQTPGPPG